MADITTGPVLRQKTFLWSGVTPTYISQLSSVQQGFALGTTDGLQVTSALLLALPDWSSQALPNPWLLSEALFPGLAVAMGEPGAAIDLAGTALRIDRGINGAVVALQAQSANNPLAEHQALLLGLSALDTSPQINWSSLLPLEDIIQLLPWDSSPSAGLVTVGTSLAGQGPITTAYTLGAGSAPSLSSQWRSYNAGPTDINAQATDAAVLTPATAGTTPRLVQVATVQATTTTGLVPNGGQDVLITALAADGSRIWEKLFGNASAEQEPRLAIGSDGSIVVGASLRGSFGLNPAAGAQDIGLASYNGDGSLRWQKLLGDSGDQLLTDISIATDGTVMVLGLTTGSVSGLYGQSLKGDGTDYDSFLTAYSPQGDRLWTYQFGSAGEDLALAMAWMPRADGSASPVDTLVVVGSQALPTAPDQPRAWVELLEVQPTSKVAPALLPPRPPTINWSNADLDPTLNLPLAVLSGSAATVSKLQLQGLSEPGSTVLVRTSLGSGVTTTAADQISGSWSLLLELPQLAAAQLGQGFVVVEARNPQGLVSDATANPVLFTGTGLPGELPQVLPIDPDGASGVLPPALLQRQITRLGSGPLTSAGERLLVDYSGTLTNGTPFDSSLNPGRRPFDLTLGAGRVITGWDLGLQGLPMGSQVRLVIPPSLAYGDRATGTIPAASTLVFDVDLRADLSVPEAFLRDVVWPSLYGSSYDQTNSALLRSNGQDLIGLALSYGPGDGSSSNDLLRIQSVQGFPAAYPLLAMGGVGNDQLIGLGQPLLAFGELGSDQLSSGDSPYAYLDGGDGDDRFESTALITWARGGSGTDSVTLPSGDWRQLDSGTVAGEPWRELGRFDASGSLVQLLDLQSVEQLQRSRWSATASSTATDELGSVLPMADGGSVVGGIRNAQALVQRRGAAGEVIWQQELGGNGSDQASALLDLGSTVVVVGSSASAAASAATGGFAPGSSNPTLQGLAAGETRGWMAFLDSATGAVQQQFLLDGPGAATISASLRLADGSLLLAGTASDRDLATRPPGEKARLRLFDPAGTPLASLDLAPGANEDPFWLKLSSDLSQAWLSTAPLANAQRIEDLAQAPDRDIWVLGESSGTKNGSVEPSDLMLWRLDADSLSVKSSQRFGSPTADTARDLQLIGSDLWLVGSAGAPLDHWLSSGADPAATTSLDLAGVSRTGSSAGSDDAVMARINTATGLPLSWQVLPGSALFEQAVAVMPWSTAGPGAVSDSLLVVVNGEANGASYSGGYDQKILQLNLQGTLQSSQSLASTASDLVVDAAAAGSQLLLAGRAIGSVDGQTTQSIDGYVRALRPFDAPAGSAVTVVELQLAASSLAALDGATNGLVDASAVTTLTGSAFDVATVYGAATAGQITGLGNEAVTLGGSSSVADANTVSGATSGVVTATITEGGLATLSTLRAGEENAYTISLTDTSVDAAALTTVNGKSSVAINATSVTTLTGSAFDVATVYGAATAGQITGLGNEAVMLGGTGGLAADLKAINTATSGLINATSVETITGNAADVKAVYAAPAVEITGLGNEAVIVTDATVSASDLLLLDERTSGGISAAGVTALTGTALERNRVFHSAGISIGLRDDQTPALAQLVGLPADGTYGPGRSMTFQLAFDEPLKVSGVPVLPLSNGLKASYDPGRSTPGQGLLAFSYTPQNGDQSTDLLIAAGASLALPLGAAITDQAGNAAPLLVPGFDASVAVDAVAPQLQQLTAPGGTYGPNRTLRLSLQFNEPVGWQADSLGSVPVLQLSQGLNAAWVAPANATPQASSTQSFDLLTGNSPPDVALLQVLGLAGQGHFMDGLGNPLVTPQASGWALPQAIRITPVASWTLDVDGDGKVTALGDGLMVIRKLFGPTFSGDALTAKAISSKATRSTADIHAYIQEGFDQGLLDIDRDGRTTALGDGLMLIRQLFGSSFSGDALINKAISASSTLIPQGQTLGSLDPTGRMALADQVRGVISELMPASSSTI